MYVKFRNQDDYDKTMSFIIDNEMNVHATENPCDFIAEDIFNYHLDSGDMTYGESEEKYLIENKYEVIKDTGNKLKQLFRPCSDDCFDIFAEVLDEHLGIK